MDSTYASGASSISVIFGIIALAVCIFLIVCEWKLFKKAGKPGWAAIIPFYNLYVLFDIIYGKGIKFLLLLVPILNVIISVAVSIRTAQVYGKGTGLGVLNLFFPFIVLPILAFGDAQYKGPVDSFL